jgi:saccharopine dehydrogenase-like NADP-dependent oxidoreductase
MDFLINGLRFRERRSELKNLFDNVLPSTKQDVVLVFCTATGYQNGKFIQMTESRKIYGKEIFLQDQSDGHWSAIQITTAAGICAVVDLFFAGNLPSKGFVRQEDVNFCDFILNRFGQFYLT